MPFLNRPIVLRVLLLLSATIPGLLPGLRAQAATADVRLDPMVVSATRTERLSDETPGTITSVDLGDDFVGATLGDLFKGESLVSVPFTFSGAGNAYGRSGSNSINIRGIEGNRVLLQVDGVRVPDEFRLGGSEPVGRDSFDPELYRRLEILQGSASALYGSDALGGVVTFTTKSPEDYQPSPFSLGAKLGYRGVDHSRNGVLTAAAAAGPVQGLVVFSRRDGRESANNGTVAPNPETYDSSAVLGKLVWSPGAPHRLELAVESFDRDFVAQADNREVVSGTGTTTENSVTSVAERFRFSAAWRYAPAGGHAWVDSLDTRLYVQDAVARDVAREVIAYSPPSGANGSFRDRLITTAFNNDTIGLSAAAIKRIGPSHRLAYGIDASRTDTSKPWSSVVLNSFGTTFPNEPRMADTRTTRLGLYLQDEADWTLAGGRKFILIPGLRLDRFKLTPDNSPLYLATTAGQRAPSFDKQAVTPKLGAMIGLTPRLNVYAQYNRGFRYPTAEDLTATFTNPVARYRTIPNPDLREETSDAYEVGIKGAPVRGVTLRAAAFSTDYRDFIEQIASAPTALQDLVNWPSGTFQTQNRAKAKIYGAELWTSIALGEFAPGLTGFRLTAAVGHSQGTYTATGGAEVRLTSVEPLKANALLAYDAPRGRFGGTLALEFVQGGRPGTGTQFYAPAATVLDLGAYWRVRERITIQASIQNLTDRKYWRYGAVRGVTTANVREQERRTQPGLNLALSTQVRF